MEEKKGLDRAEQDKKRALEARERANQNNAERFQREQREHEQRNRHRGR